MPRCLRRDRGPSDNGTRRNLTVACYAAPTSGPLKSRQKQGAMVSRPCGSVVGIDRSDEQTTLARLRRLARPPTSITGPRARWRQETRDRGSPPMRPAGVCGTVERSDRAEAASCRRERLARRLTSRHGRARRSNWNPARRLPLNEVHVWRIRIRVIPILASLTNLERLPITAAQETRIRRVPGRAHGPPPVPGAVEEVLRSQDRLKPEHVAAICQRAA